MLSRLAQLRDVAGGRVAARRPKANRIWKAAARRVRAAADGSRPAARSSRRSSPAASPRAASRRIIEVRCSGRSVTHDGKNDTRPRSDRHPDAARTGEARREEHGPGGFRGACPALAGERHIRRRSCGRPTTGPPHIDLEDKDALDRILDEEVSVPSTRTSLSTRPISETLSTDRPRLSSSGCQPARISSTFSADDHGVPAGHDQSASLQAPLPADRATENIDGLLRLPHAVSPSEGKPFWATYLTSGARGSRRGSMSPDTHRRPRRELGSGSLYSATTTIVGSVSSRARPLQ